MCVTILNFSHAKVFCGGRREINEINEERVLMTEYETS
jgi:hypothetical protein